MPVRLNTDDAFVCVWKYLGQMSKFCDVEMGREDGDGTHCGRFHEVRK